jgi:hypothetical protein
MAKPKKKSSASLLDDIITNAQESGAKLDVENAAEFFDSKPGKKPGKKVKEASEPVEKKPEQEKKIKRSYDLSQETARNIARLKHWEQLPNEGAALELILKPYFKKHPQEPLKNEI